MAVLHWSAVSPLLQARYIPDSVNPATPWETAPVWFDEASAPEPEFGPDMRHSDFDLLPNWYEAFIGTDPYNPDTDGDSITDRDELVVTFTNPLDIDSNDNGWTDYEDWSGQSLPSADPDNDGLTNLDELNAGTNVRSADSDGDGLTDGIESNSGGTYSALLADTDADGTSDYNEYYGITTPEPPPVTQPPDTDGDGLTDDQEANLGTLIDDSDTDDDGLNDGLEVTWGSSPTPPTSAPSAPTTGNTSTTRTATVHPTNTWPSFTI